MKSKILLLLFISLVAGSCNQKTPSSDSQSTDTQQTVNSNASSHNTETKADVSSTSSSNIKTNHHVFEGADNSSIDPNIQFIQDKYNTINNAKDYETFFFATRCDAMSLDQLERRYNKNGKLSYLKHVVCGRHGCRTREHYYWEGELILIFQMDDLDEGVTSVKNENHTYFKNGQLIRCLEKKARYYEGQPPMEELWKKAKNKEVDCTPEKLTAKLSELESLSIDEAQKYFCPSTSTEVFSLTDGKLGYPSMSSFLFDINFDGKKEILVASPEQGQRGRTLFMVYDWKGNQLTEEPYNQFDSETSIDMVAEEVIIHSSGGACGSISKIYQLKNDNLQLVKRLQQNMEDGKCMESTYKISNGIESFVSKKELKH